VEENLIKHNALNGICPYFTMFPLSFPYSILHRNAKSTDWVLDPFCGRGTTNYASRMLGLPSVGIDSNPVAVAITEAKLVNTTASCILQAAKRILDEVEEPIEIPTGEFWVWAFDRKVLHTICRLREGLIDNCRSDARKALRAIVMGALHGPQQKTFPSYFSNQSPRTYAPKPRYAVNYWKRNHMRPQRVDVMEIIARRANRYYGSKLTRGTGLAICGDSRVHTHSRALLKDLRFDWVITSPPYYGMRTYIPDQWLRLWFIGGKSDVDYSNDNQLSHTHPEIFASQLRSTWENVGSSCSETTRMVIRFGGINDRHVDPLSIIKLSLKETAWRIITIKQAGSADAGRRQVLHFSSVRTKPITEYDVWAIRND
jgi:hypothetical protein